LAITSTDLPTTVPDPLVVTNHKVLGIPSVLDGIAPEISTQIVLIPVLIPSC